MKVFFSYTYYRSERRSRLMTALREVFGLNEASLEIVLVQVEELMPGLLKTLPT